MLYKHNSWSIKMHDTLLGEKRTVIQYGYVNVGDGVYI